jgi:hypothetical protein
MSKLTTLKDKDPKEAARLLSLVAGSLLPNPGVSELVHQSDVNREFIKAVLSEVRWLLRVRESDQSIKSNSQIYAFLSQEISRAMLTREVVSDVEARLGNRGELHPSQYEVRFGGDTLGRLEATGERKSNIIEAVTHPDHVVHLKAKYLSEQVSPRPTISIKFITTKRAEDRFILIVYGQRVGKVQYVGGGFRVYTSDVRLDNPNDPVDVMRSFVNHFGATFRIGNKDYKLMLNEIISVDRPVGPSAPLLNNISILDQVEKHIYSTVFIGGETTIKGGDVGFTGEVVLGFIFDLTKYLADLRSHNVALSPDVENIHRRTGFASYSIDDLRM